MHGRCSPLNVQRRFHAPVPVMTPGMAGRLLAPPDGWSLVCEQADEIIAVISTAPVPVAEVGSARSAEVGLIVEDAWQRHGIGSALLRRVVQRAPLAGFEQLELMVHPDNTAVLAMVATLGLRARIALQDGCTQITLPLLRRPRVVTVLG